ncbi:unnamed protein product [Rotaria sp. Silwood2]|nr:unnamed protein product [Rotaria sp. Silwood2]
MEQTKPQRRTIIFDYWNVNKKLKLIEESKSSSRQSVTLIEDLSNEIFYEIFNHLYVYYVYKAFYNLNIRLQNLLTNSTLPLKINVSSISKSIFQSCHRHIIMPNKLRITSSRQSVTFIEDLSNEFSYEIFNHLHVYYVYKTFYNVNISLESVFMNLRLPLKISVSSMSKSICQSYNRHIIMLNSQRITSLCLSNPFIVDVIFSPVRIASNFTRLETLIIDNIKSKYLINILNYFF